MKITDYPSVDSLADNDVILIDGNSGTKKLVVGGDISKMTSSFNSSDNASETGIITSAGGETSMTAMTSGDTHGGLFGGLSKAVLNTRKLINTVKRIWQTVANAWVSGASYSVGQVVTYTNGHTYICKLAHTSSTSIKPGNTTYWEDKTIGDMIYSLNSNYAKIGKLVFKSSSTGTKESKFRATRDFIVSNYSIADCSRLAVSFNGLSFSVNITSNGYMSFVSLSCGTDARLIIEAAAVSNVNSCIVTRRVFEFNTTDITNINTSSDINDGYSVEVYDYTIKS